MKLNIQFFGGRGATSGSLSVVENRILGIEKLRGGYNKEVLMILSKDGKIEDEIIGTETEAVYRGNKPLKDKILSHNHPNIDGYNYPYYSKADIDILFQTQANETRISTNKETLSLKRNGSVSRDISKKYDSVLQKTYNKADTKNLKGAEYYDYVSKTMQKWLKRNAKKYGFKFTIYKY